MDISQLKKYVTNTEAEVSEQDALNDYKKIDKADLENYFSDIINRVRNNSYREAKDYLRTKHYEIEELSQTAKIRELKKGQLKIEIHDCFVKNDSTYKNAINQLTDEALEPLLSRNASQTELNNLRSMCLNKDANIVASRCIKIIDGNHSNIQKLIAICRFEKETKDIILYQKLYQLEVRNQYIIFRELFRKDEDWIKVINLLMNKNFFSGRNGNITWNEVDRNDYSPKQQIVILLLTLIHKKYLVQQQPLKVMQQLITDQFNFSVDYSYFRKEFKKFEIEFDDQSTTNNSVLKFFFFIPLKH